MNTFSLEFPYFLLHEWIIICLVGLTSIYLAAVLLKQYIKKHWDEDEEDFEHPIVASNEKVPPLLPKSKKYIYIKKKIVFECISGIVDLKQHYHIGLHLKFYIQKGHLGCSGNPSFCCCCCLKNILSHHHIK